MRESQLQREGLLMDWDDACWHRRSGEHIVRIAWGSLLEREDYEITPTDRAAGDWVIVKPIGVRRSDGR
jgi:hypothetical protein